MDKYDIKSIARECMVSRKKELLPSNTPKSSSIWSSPVQVYSCSLDTRNSKIILTLAVEDFGINYFKKEDAQRLFNVLQGNYKISSDRTCRSYFGLTTNWHYAKDCVGISMSGYIVEAL